MKPVNILLMYIISCIIGITGEGITGWIIYHSTGKFLWTYPDSPLVTTSIYIAPLWGFVGLIFYLTGSKILDH